MEDFYWLNKDSITFLKRGYLEEGVEPLDRIRQIANEAERRSNIKGFSDKFYNYMSKGWISLSTPIWCNYGLTRGLAISCFGGTYMDDTSDILRGVAEAGMLSKAGGGTAGYFGNLRPRGSSISGGGKTNGSVAFMEMFESTMNIITQGSSRRGSFAAYLPIEHGDIEEFLTIRNDESPIQHLSLGVTVKDDFLIDVRDNKNKDKAKILTKVHKKRSESGYPYIFFEDNVNRQAPQVYKDKGLKIKHSQLCAEIMEYTDDEKTFTCCLSSVNLLHYEDWKNTDLVETMMIFLDTVLEEFVDKASTIPFLEKAVKFAVEHKSVGLGVLGLHSYLQKNMIAFDSVECKKKLNEIFSNINSKSLNASKKLAKEKGEPLILKGYGERFTTRLALAPTTSSSFILGQVSPSIEPLNSNYFIKDLAKIKVPYRNPNLEELLESRGLNNEDIWKSILLNGGSVQHLEFLTAHEKEVFKTFGEINQVAVVENAGIIQQHVDQGISLNLMIHPETSLKDINSLVYHAWELGLKSLYYQRSSNIAQELSRKLNNCSNCEA